MNLEPLAVELIKGNLAQIRLTVNLHQNATALMIANSGTYDADFSEYGFLIDQRFGAYGNMRNDTVYNLAIKSNTELDKTQEISEMMKGVQQQAANIWLSQDVDVYVEGLGVGPVMFNNWLLCTTTPPTPASRSTQSTTVVLHDVILVL